MDLSTLRKKHTDNALKTEDRIKQQNQGNKDRIFAASILGGLLGKRFCERSVSVAPQPKLAPSAPAAERISQYPPISDFNFSS